jgi:manganese/iron transport system permease protein
MTWLTEPFRFGFMQTALAAVIVIAATCAFIGVYVVLRRMAFIGDAIAHTTLPGLVFAALRGGNLLAGAIVAAGVTALGIGWLSRRQAVREDTAIGVVFTAAFALGIAMMTAARSYRDFTHMLFGNILGVSRADLVAMAVVAAIVIGALVAVHKEMELTSFDPTYARSVGLDPDRLRYLLLVLLALTVVMGIQAVGVVLTSALLVTPAAGATLLSSRLPPMIALAAAMAVLAGLGGLYLSFYYGVASGAAIVLTATVLFGVAYAGSLRRRTGSAEVA